MEPKAMLRSEQVLLVAGTVFIIRLAVSLFISLRYFYKVHLSTLLGSRVDLKQTYGQWALVSGASSGIGLHLAKELANEGLDLVLVSRSLPKLRAVASDIEKQYGVKTKVIAADATDKTSNDKVVEEIKDLPIGILVNNVGLNIDVGARPINELDSELIYNMIVVNSGSSATLSRGVLPGMRARKKGLLVNIGSTSGYYPVPYQNIYTSTKSFLLVLSTAMHQELASEGVTVSVVYPQFVQTNMTSGNKLIHNLPFWTQKPTVFARSCVRLFGKTTETAGHWLFDFFIWLAGLFPQQILLAILYYPCRFVRLFSKERED